MQIIAIEFFIKYNYQTPIFIAAENSYDSLSLIIKNGGEINSFDILINIQY